MKFRNLVVAVAGALFMALTSFAQITAIEGDVKGEDGTPKVNAVVKREKHKVSELLAHLDVVRFGHRARSGLTTQAQRPGAWDARIATATPSPGSLQRMVRPFNKHSVP